MQKHIQSFIYILAFMVTGCIISPDRNFSKANNDEAMLARNKKSRVVDEDAYTLNFHDDFRAFSSSSPWNTPIEEDAETHASSNTIISYIYNTKNQKFIRFANSYVPAIWRVDSSKLPKHHAHSQTHIYQPFDLDGNNISDESIPIVPEMFIEPTTDGHISIVDMSLGKVWEMSRAKWIGGQLQCTTFNIWNLNGVGYGEPVGNWWQMQGGRGSGFPVIAGALFPSEVLSGEIRHALVFTLEDIRDVSGGQIFIKPPASRSDGTLNDTSKPLQGMRFQLVATEADFNSWGLSTHGKVVARCLVKYGAYLGDRGGNMAFMTQLRGETSTKHRQEWDRLVPGLYSNIQKIPVNKFRVVYTGEPFIKNE